MNSILFQYALLPISFVKEKANWIVIDNSINYTSVDILDFPLELKDQVFAVYENTYKQYINTTKNLLIPEPDGLFEYNRWILFYDDQDSDKKVISFLLFKTTNFGLKSGLTGSNGSYMGRKSVISFNINSFNSEGCYGEISDKLEDAILKHVPIVDFVIAKKILTYLGKLDVVQKEDNHYSREIGNLGILTKIMVGIPILPKP